MSRTREWSTRLGWIAGAAVGFFAWAEFLWTPIHDFLHEPRKTFGDLLLNLLNPVENVYHVPFAGWAFLVLSAALALWVALTLRAIGTYLDVSRRNLSIIDSSFELAIDDDEMTRSTLSRTQYVHANRRGIRAYRSVSNVENPGAEMRLDTLRTSSTLNGQNITKRVLQHGTKTHIEMIEDYDRELPTSLIATYLPNDLVRMLFNNNNGLFRSLVVRRHLVIEQLREYCGDVGIVSVTANQFPATNISLKVIFPAKTAPDPNDISCFLITESAVRPLDPTPSIQNGRPIYEITYPNLYQASLRFQWSNAKLKRHLAAKASGARRAAGRR